MVEILDVFSSLDMKKIFMHLCRILFFLKKRSDRKSLFSMDALKQLYQPVENHTLSKKSIWMYKKKKKIIQLDALLMLLLVCCFFFFAIYKWALSFLFVCNLFFFGKNLRQVFQRRLYLSSTCIYRKLRKRNKKTYYNFSNLFC